MEANVSNWISSCDTMKTQKSRGKVGKQYYQGKHDIEGYKAVYYDADGNLKEDTYRSNYKISHPFFRVLVDQKPQHLLSGKGPKIISEIPRLQDELNRYFDKKFESALGDAIQYAVMQGFGYLYLYADKDGTYSFAGADPQNIYEILPKDTEDGKPRVLNVYLDGEDTICEEWTDETVTYWIKRKNENDYELDETREINPRPHLLKIDEDGRAFGKSLGFIPFFRLDNNDDLESDLYLIKSLIDDYDIMACGLTNNIQDSAETIMLVKGYGGDDLNELQATLKQQKVAGVDSEGGVETIVTQIPFEARCKKMEIDRRGIYDFGMGFDPQKVGDGNITNVVIQSRYAQLEMACEKLLKKVLVMLEPIVKLVLDDINSKNAGGYDLADIGYDFTRTTISNEVDDATIAKVRADERSVNISTLLSARELLGDDCCRTLVCQEFDIEEPTSTPMSLDTDEILGEDSSDVSED